MTAPTELWSAAEALAADAYTMSALGVPSAVLMERASLTVAAEVQARAGQGPVVCLVGPGNNGADALAVARILAGRGMTCTAWLVTERRNDAAQAQLAIARAHGVAVTGTSEALPQGATWVDGLLGTGARGVPRGEVAEAMAWLQSRQGAVVAIDAPSGVDVDTGAAASTSVRADCTVTFVRSKLGLHVTPGRDHAGAVVIADIGITASAEGTSIGTLLTTQGVAAQMRAVPGLRDAGHKGHRGHVGVLGGSAHTEGAVLLAGAAAMRAGAGLCTLVVPEGAAGTGARPELMQAPWGEPWAPRASVLVVGPGLTGPVEPDALARLFLEDPRPAVWDASGLDHVPLHVDAAGPRVLTPHPGEAARLLARADPAAGWTTAKVQASRVEAVVQLQAATRSTVVLKGAGTLLAGPEGLRVATEGTAALATAGSGDVLAGAIGAWLGRGLGADAAADVAVSVHGRAGMVASSKVGTALAMDIADALPWAERALLAGEPGTHDPAVVAG
ncbi:MAG: NAD(P)H-hydrate dehydratase [Myxococcota bacterium]